MTGWRARKLELERQALVVVYDAAAFEEIRHQERPDFVLRHGPATPPFGVEITQCFQTQSDARAKQHPEYVSALLAGAPHMHRDDVETLAVAAASIRDADGNLRSEDVPCIVRPIPSPAERAAALAEVVTRKTSKLAGYDTELSHVNLIVVDEVGESRERTSEVLLRESLSPELRRALRHTSFREVFVVTRDTEGERIYRPLQMLVLMETFNLFLGALNACDPVRDAIDLADVVPLFVRVLNRGDCLPVRYGDAGDGLDCAVYRGVGIRYQEGSGMNVLDFHDYPTPDDREVPAVPLSHEELADFTERYSRFAEVNACTTELAFPSSTRPTR